MIFFILMLLIPSLTMIISLYNLFTAPRISEGERYSHRHPFISVLIPARDEERNIELCLSSVLCQNYSNYEVIVLDDHSSDRTGIILERMRQGNERLKVYQGLPLPDGWLGKNWACKQLSDYAKGELLLFIDADVQLSPSALGYASGLFAHYGLKMLSCFPTQILKTPGEYLTVPSMHWILLAFLPLRSVLSSPSVSYIAASGQFIMFDKKAYEQSGGHAAVASEVVEDMALARILKKQTGKVMAALGHNAVFCRMYRGFGEAVKGFSKNFFPGFNSGAWLFLMVLLIIISVSFLPFFLVFFNGAFTAVLILILLTRLFISLAGNQSSVINILLHPFQMVVLAALGIYSVIINKRKRVLWKGRSI